MYSDAITTHKGYKNPSSLEGGWGDFSTNMQTANNVLALGFELTRYDMTANTPNVVALWNALADLGRQEFDKLPDTVRIMIERYVNRTLWRTLMMERWAIAYQTIGIIVILDTVRAEYGLGRITAAEKIRLRDLYNNVESSILPIGIERRTLYTGLKKILHNVNNFSGTNSTYPQALDQMRSSTVGNPGARWENGVFNLLPRIRNNDVPLAQVQTLDDGDDDDDYDDDDGDDYDDENQLLSPFVVSPQSPPAAATAAAAADSPNTPGRVRRRAEIEDDDDDAMPLFSPVLPSYNEF